MIITVNGESREVAEGTTVAALLQEMGIPAERVAVEVNLKVISRDTLQATVLQPGDKVEIVQFMGGGTLGRDDGDRPHESPARPLGPDPLTPPYARIPKRRNAWHP